MNVCHEGSPIVTFSEAWHADEEAPPAAEATDERSREYCRVRAAAERAAAKKASALHAQRIHQELAQAYALRAKGSSTQC